MPAKTKDAYVPITERVPWAQTSIDSGIPLHLDYFEGSMFDKVSGIAEQQL